jgi:ATP-binding cassette, subfamily C (CFTR/MRP), member 1
MVQQFAQNEQNMNAVERVLVFSELPPEGDAHTPNDPPASWPEKGSIKFTAAELAYREGLPLVLNGISFEVVPGEKVGSISYSQSQSDNLKYRLG